MLYNYGLINLLKPSGPTSADMVNRVKRLTGCKKIGHMGTLDPLAAGVLIIALGRATKLFDIITGSPKTYRAIFTFGTETDTGDSAGEVLRSGLPIPDKSSILSALEKFCGSILQRPHKYSAVKIAGKKAYNLARDGVDFEIAPKSVHIYKYELLEFDGKDSFMFDITVSSGTYIRSLCIDLAGYLNTAAYMSTLIRTSSGMFNINNAVTLEDMESRADLSDIVQKPESAVDLPKLILPDKYYKDLDNGVPVPCEYGDKDNILIYCGDVFFGVGNVRQKVLKLNIKLKND